jgi:hypothetical protein
LNTETLIYTHEGVDIVCLQNGLVDGSWSECLQFALNSIDEEIVIYMQEDYFMSGAVNSKEINNAFALLKKRNFDCLHLTDQCNNGPFIKETGIDMLWEIPRKVEYRVSMQAAIWNKNSLLKILNSWESGWEFERFGTKRSNALLDKVMCVNQSSYGDKRQILPYIFTGIIKGQWNPEVVEPFEQNGILIDYQLRGFVERLEVFSLKSKIKTLTNIMCSYFRNYVYYKIKMK